MIQSRTALETSKLANHPVAPERDPASCSAAMKTSNSNGYKGSLDADSIGLFVWNIHKNKHPDALDDLSKMARNMDLVLLQEARLADPLDGRLQQIPYWSFAPGYYTNRSTTGVMTISSVQPLTHCYLQTTEPWLRTPKMVGISEFALSGTDRTLAVVNIHGVNFTLGSRDFAHQLSDIREAIEAHDGPVIVAGDFNTWNGGRIKRLEHLSSQLGLTELQFEQDHRVSPFAHTIDRVLVRGLQVVNATTKIVDSSDHNPLSVRLSL